MNIELIVTRDGSHSLYRHDLGEHYHSVFGAIQESMHIFIMYGLLDVGKKGLQVFEMGFGTGLNVLLTWIYTAKEQKDVKYYSIEKYPLAYELIAQLNYTSFLPQESPVIFEAIHKSKWDADINLGHLVLHKVHADIQDFAIPSGNDLVYFDAFSPDKEPHLWSNKIFHKIYDSMSVGGIFVTYSAKGEVRKKLLSAGFRIEKLPSSPGKKHILRAFKQ